MTSYDPFWELDAPADEGFERYRAAVLGRRAECPTAPELEAYLHGRCEASRAREVASHVAGGCGFCRACLDGFRSALGGYYFGPAQQPKAASHTDTHVPGALPAPEASSSDTRVPGDTWVPGVRHREAVGVRPYAAYLLAEMGVGQEHADELAAFASARLGPSLPTAAALVGLVAEFAAGRGLEFRGGPAVVERAVVRRLLADETDGHLRAFWRAALAGDRVRPDDLARMLRSESWLAPMDQGALPDLVRRLEAATKQLVTVPSVPAVTVPVR